MYKGDDESHVIFHFYLSFFAQLCIYVFILFLYVIYNTLVSQDTYITTTAMAYVVIIIIHVELHIEYDLCTSLHFASKFI